MSTDPRRAAQHRKAVRAFVRVHHPDVGGDPVAFVAGLARLRAAGPAQPSGAAGRVSCPHDDPRLDAPVVVLDEPMPVRVARSVARHVRRLLVDLGTTPIRID